MFKGFVAAMTSGRYYIRVRYCWKVWKCWLLSCVQLFCDPMDCSPPGSSVYWILPANILEWVAILFSRESSWPRDWTQVSCFAGRFFTTWATREALHIFCSVAQSCPTLCHPIDCSTPGLPVHHQLPEPTQTHVHHIRDAIQPSHPLSSPSPPAFNLS